MVEVVSIPGDAHRGIDSALLRGERRGVYDTEEEEEKSESRRL